MAVPSELIYRFNIVSIKIPTDFCEEINKPIPKPIGKCRGPRTVKNNLEKEEQR